MRKLNLLLTLVALSLATSSLWAKPAVADANGKLPGKFQVACDKYVYFSQGNLQYNSDTQQWQFADEQYDYIGGAAGNTSITENGIADGNGIVDLFGCVGNSSNWTGLKQYGITTNYTTNSANGYGVSDNEPLKKDWATLAISNGGNTENYWHTLTKDEWTYLIYNRFGAKVEGTFGSRYAKATINKDGDEETGITGVILFPDGGTFAADEFTVVSNINRYNADFESTICTSLQWIALEAKGCVFLPSAGRRIFGSYSGGTTWGGYQISTEKVSYATNANCFIFDNTSNPGLAVSQCARYQAQSVRLTKYVDPEDNPARPKAYVTSDPVGKSNLTYTGGSQTLLESLASGATGGTVKYKLSTSGSWSTSNPSATNAGEYTVQWFVDATGCYDDSDIQEIHVTIKRRSAGVAAPSPMPTIEATSLTYNGSAQDLVTATGDLQSGYTTVYSTDGVNWSTTIPQETDAGDYTVYYKFYKGNNEEYIPSPNTIEVTISPADIVLPSFSTDLIYDGTPQPLLDITGIVGGTIYYSVDGNEPWLTECPSETEIGTYDIWYKVVPDNSNYNAIPATKVTVTIDDPYPFVADNADPTTKLTELLNTPSDLKVKRTIYADDEYNTICLPFALDESALAASPLAGFNRLKTFKGAQVTGTAPDLYIDIFVEDATTIEAGIPYLITYPSAHANIVNPVFTGITVTTTTPSATSADGVTFQGMFAQVHIDPYDAGHTQDYLFVGANSQLYWPSSDQTSSSIKMRGFRAYFIIDRNSISPALAPKGTRARIMDAPKTTTAIDELNASNCTKFIENGQLYIIKNGVKYNAQGQIVK